MIGNAKSAVCQDATPTSYANTPEWLSRASIIEPAKIPLRAGLLEGFQASGTFVKTRGMSWDSAVLAGFRDSIGEIGSLIPLPGMIWEWRC